MAFKSPKLIFSEAPIKLTIGKVNLEAKFIDITIERKSNNETINKYLNTYLLTYLQISLTENIINNYYCRMIDNYVKYLK